MVQEGILKHGTPVTLHSDRGKEFTTALHQEACDLLCIVKMYSTAYRPQVNDMVECCNHTLLAMLRAVVSEQQDDWDDQLPALLSAYRSTPHSSKGVSPYRMLYGVEMTMPLDLILSDIGSERPDIHCPTEYVGWLRGSIGDAHVIARTNLKKAANAKRKVMAKPVEPLCSSEETGCGMSTPLLVEVSYTTETEGHGWCWQRQVL